MDLASRVTCALALVVTAACGSTVGPVPTGEQSLASQAPVAGPLEQPAPAVGEPLPGEQSLPGGVSRGVPRGSTPDTDALASGTADGGTGGRQLPTKGTLPTIISIGIGYVGSAQAANEALGVGSLVTGDLAANFKAVVDNINTHGGVAGRKLVPVYHPYDPQSAQTYAQQEQAACADYTQDHKVIAVADTGLTPGGVVPCLNAAGVLSAFSGDVISQDRSFYRRNPSYFDLGTLTQDRMMAQEVSTLKRLGYFGGWDPVSGSAGKTTKVGVLGYDSAAWTGPERSVLLPALKAAGREVSAADVINVRSPSSAADNAQTVQEIQSAVLKFRTDGITHVIFLDSDTSLTLFFGKVSKQQGYYPRFGNNSGAGMQALLDAQLLDGAVFRGALGMGWFPGIDLPASAAKAFKTPAQKHCDAVMNAHGIHSSSAASEANQNAACDQLFFLKQVIEASGSDLSLRSLRSTAESLGSRFASAQLPTTLLSAQQHDGVAVSYDFGYEGSCGCVRYRGGARRVA